MVCGFGSATPSLGGVTRRGTGSPYRRFWEAKVGALESEPGLELERRRSFFRFLRAPGKVCATRRTAATAKSQCRPGAKVPASPKQMIARSHNSERIKLIPLSSAMLLNSLTLRIALDSREKSKNAGEKHKRNVKIVGLRL